MVAEQNSGGPKCTSRRTLAARAGQSVSKPSTIVTPRFPLAVPLSAPQPMPLARNRAIAVAKSGQAARRAPGFEREFPHMKRTVDQCADAIQPAIRVVLMHQFAC